ncbi:hypothetical protein JD844_017098 [Phrynosoma platyrhinos]|uniref:Cadherin domain-containing protein n=1 Tax=Phrynosoma platyrhinos TaxID=52577 RepID=A0ABQ7SLC2_PHRPL|nr:hypothetical protein JD844_017098 [Phrynosoma platyrhinos]
MMFAWKAISGQIRYSIPEEMHKGSFVGNIVNDLGMDRKQVSDHGLRIVASKGMIQYFELNFHSGHLQTSERIDREEICGKAEICILKFQVIVESTLRLYVIEVEIIDINDNVPSFLPMGWELKISETSNPGSQFPLPEAQDPDLGTNSVQGYELTGSSHFFLMMQRDDDGVKHTKLVLEKALDREVQSIYDLILTATDGGDPIRSGTLQIHIIVLDSNDNAPIFSQSAYEVSVNENIPRWSTIATVKATDLDEGINAEIKYSFQKITKKISQIFHLNLTTGEITLVGSLDYEESSLYEFEVQATDGGGLSDRTKVVVFVADLNDNAPELTMTFAISSVSENSPTGTIVAILNVQDRDSGVNGQVTCSVPSNLPFLLKKTQDDFYTLVTERSLDREEVASYNITITATDKGTPTLSAFEIISLQVLDTNDNPPVFVKSAYTSYLLENNPRGASIFSLKANDPDWEENARICYSIIEDQISESLLSSYLSINSETGVVYALNSFDYEQIQEMQFQVKAQDGELAPRSSEPGYLVTKVVAVDADSGQNAWLSYQLTKATEPGLFTLGLHTGEIRTARFLLEKDALKQSLVVLVKDNGQPPLSASVTVTVVLAESIPEMLSDLRSISVPVDPPSDLTFYLVVAVAFVSCLFLAFLLVLMAIKLHRWRNSQLSESGNVNLSGVPISQFVGIDGVRAFLQSYCHEVSLTNDSRKSKFNTSKIIYSGPPSNEPTSDLKDPILSGEDLYLNNGDLIQLSHVTFDISPIELSKSTVKIHYSIPEEEQKGSIVGNIGLDLGIDISGISGYKIHIGCGGRIPYFALNHENGHLYTTERIDREEICDRILKCLLNCDIIVKNQMKLYAIEVEIIDINDNAPRFPAREHKLKISEISVPGSHFPLPEAQDPDLGNNTVQSYQLIGSSHFSLDVQMGPQHVRNPILVLDKMLDREEQSVYDLILTATDGGNPVRSGTVLVQVIVLDANDNSPVFNQHVYKVTVKEDIPRGSTLCTVSATDLDEGINGEVNYSFRNIEEAATQIFHLNFATGEITLTKNLDYEESPLHEFQVEAEDAGGLSDRAKVIITVIDVNDNAPQVEVSSHINFVSEDSPPGTVVALLNIQDLDSETNGKVFCSIDTSLPFQLKKSYNNYYTLMTERPLDREQAAYYNISITVTDHGVPPLSTTCTVSLQIFDTNDNHPHFTESSYTSYIMENNQRGASIFSLKANDPDWEENARICYSITESQIGNSPLSSYLSINSETGVVYALNSFDYEEIQEIQFQVKAQDGGSPPLSSNVSVTLFILDQNDNPPKILYPSPPTDGSTGIELAPRSSEPGYLVTKVVAVDADSGQNAWLSYQLTKATEPGLFTLGLHTGEIRTARFLLEKDALKQSLVVLVKDNGQPTLSASVTVTVVLADSIPEMLSDLNSISAPVDPPSNLTFYLVVAVAFVSCLFLTFLLVLLAIRLHRWRNSHLFESGKVTFSGVPVSQFVGIDGVQAFLQSYCHEVSLTTDSRKSKTKSSEEISSNTLTNQQTNDNILIAEDFGSEKLSFNQVSYWALNY